MRRWPHLDGLRAIAALLVLASHVGFWTGQTAHGFVGGVLARGDSGVAVFFALSAFLLAGPWLGDARARGRIRSYAVRRVARIAPASWVVLVAVLVAAPWWGQGLPTWPTIAAHIGLLQGYVGPDLQAFTQTWSLTTELTFYLLLPLLLPALARRLPRRRVRWVGLGGAVALGVGLQGVITAADRSSDSRWWGVLAVSVLGHLAWFTVGLGVLALRGQDPDSPRHHRWLDDAGGLFLVAGTILVVAATGLAGPRDLAVPTPGQAIVKELLYAAFAAVLLLAATTPSSDAGWLSSPLMAALGRWSYGIFLWHVLVVQGLYAVVGLPLFGGHALLIALATIPLTVGLAALTYRLIEAPAIAWAHRARAGRRAPARD